MKSFALPQTFQTHSTALQLPPFLYKFETIPVLVQCRGLHKVEYEVFRWLFQEILLFLPVMSHEYKSLVLWRKVWFGIVIINHIIVPYLDRISQLSPLVDSP